MNKTRTIPIILCSLLAIALMSASHAADIDVTIPWQGGTTFTTNINVYGTTLGYSKTLRITPERCYRFKATPMRTSDRLTVVDGTINNCEANYTMTLTSTNLQGWIQVSGEIEPSNECDVTCGGGGGTPQDQDFDVTVTQRVAWAYYTVPNNHTNLTGCAGCTNTVETKVVLGDAGIPSAGTVNFSVAASTLGTFTQNNITLSPSGTATTGFIGSTNGGSGTITASATGLQDEAGKSVPNVATNLSVIVTKVEILKPKGSLDGNPNPTNSWLTTPCYHFDFQGLVSGATGTYVLDVQGQINPVPPASYKWTLDSAAGSLANDTAASPTHTAPATAGTGILLLKSLINSTDSGCSTQRTVKIYQDHLARDMENFGTGISCIAPWSFTRFNVAINMASTWNCRGAVWHAYNGSGNGFSSAAPDSWTSTEFLPPINWTSVTALLSRGDVVSFYGGEPDILAHQHNHTCTGNGSQMYGANNEPSVDFTANPPATWKWSECTSQEYFDAVNAVSQTQLGYDFLRKVVVHKKP